MGLVKRTYVDGETVITADNLNDIQDEIIQNASDISTKGTYSKPSGGIPSTDLASAVQTSLGKADTALQSSDIDNTLTVSGKAADAKKTGDEISGVKNTLTQLDGEIDTLDNKVAQIGTVIVGTNAASLNVPPNTATDISSLTLGEGVYVLTAGFEFSKSLPGSLCIGQMMNGAYLVAGTTIRFDGNSGGGYNASAIVSVASNETFSIRAFQTSSVTTVSAAYVTLKAIRIA